MSKIICEKAELTAVADAIRAKTNTAAAMSLGEMATNVMSISGGSGGSADNGFNVAVVPGDIASGTLNFIVGSWENVISNMNLASLVIAYGGNGGAFITLEGVEVTEDGAQFVYAGKMTMHGTSMKIICRVDINGNYTLSVEQGESGGLSIKSIEITDYNTLLTFVTANSSKIFRVTLDSFAGIYSFSGVSENGLTAGAIQASTHTNTAVNPVNEMLCSMQELYIPAHNDTLPMRFSSTLIAGNADGAVSWENELDMEITPDDFSEVINKITLYYID